MAILRKQLSIFEQVSLKAHDKSAAVDIPYSRKVSREKTFKKFVCFLSLTSKFSP